MKYLFAQIRVDLLTFLVGVLTVIWIDETAVVDHHLARKLLNQLLRIDQ